MNFKHLHVNKPELLKAVFEAETNPIVVIDESEHEHKYYNTIEDKLTVLNGDLSLARILFIWEGKKKTDVFELRQEDIDQILNLFN